MISRRAMLTRSVAAGAVAILSSQPGMGGPQSVAAPTSASPGAAPKRPVEGNARLRTGRGTSVAADRAGSDVDAVSRANAQIQAAVLRDSPVISGAIGQGRLKVVAAHYELASGAVTLLS